MQNKVNTQKQINITRFLPKIEIKTCEPSPGQSITVLQGDSLHLSDSLKPVETANFKTTHKTLLLRALIFPILS